MAELMRVPVEISPRAQNPGGPNDLRARINQIFNQKGPFRNVTEDTIANELSSQGSDDDNNDEVQKGVSDDEADPERTARERHELFDTITQSNVQINSALDFISMVLSQTSQIAKGSFSEGLRQAVGPGMFDSIVLADGHVEPNVKSLAELSKGWKITSYDKASQNLLAASERFQKHTGWETSFWSQVAAVGQKGWKISRHPLNSQIIGVHFGSSESAPQFRTRGFAPLRRDSDSNLFLDRSGLSPTRKRVSVEVIKDDQLAGTYTPSVPLPEGDGDLAIQITNARDDLFDDELFHEIGREARLAANQGIITREEDVEFAIGDQIRVKLSLKTPTISSSSTNGQYDALANYISLSLRSLLLQAHCDNRVKRSTSPAPISAKQIPRPEYALLRPLIAALRHSIAVFDVQQQIRRIVISPLERAGLEASFTLQATQAQFENPDSTTCEAIVSAGPQTTKMTLKLPTGKQAEVKIITYLGRPTYGTSYEVSEVLYDFATSQLCHYDTPNALARAVERLTILDLVALVAQKNENAENENATRDWSISQARKGLLTLSSGSPKEDGLTLRLQLESDTLLAQIESRSSQRSTTRLVVSWIETGTIHSGDSNNFNLTLGPDLTFEKLISRLMDKS